MHKQAAIRINISAVGTKLFPDELPIGSEYWGGASKTISSGFLYGSDFGVAVAPTDAVGCSVVDVWVASDDVSVAVLPSNVIDGTTIGSLNPPENNAVPTAVKNNVTKTRIFIFVLQYSTLRRGAWPTLWKFEWHWCVTFSFAKLIPKFGCFFWGSSTKLICCLGFTPVKRANAIRLVMNHRVPLRLTQKL